MSFDRRKVWLVVALLAATALFVVGVTLERTRSHHEEATGTVASSEGGTEHAETEHSEGGSSGEASSTESNETVFGIDIESTLLMTVAVVLSLGPAALVWLRPEVPVLVALVVVGLLFTALDVVEVVRQTNESQAGLAVLASIVAFYT